MKDEFWWHIGIWIGVQACQAFVIGTAEDFVVGEDEGGEGTDLLKAAGLQWQDEGEWVRCNVYVVCVLHCW
jgi:hypothetical protein